MLIVASVGICPAAFVFFLWYPSVVYRLFLDLAFWERWCGRTGRPCLQRNLER